MSQLVKARVSRETLSTQPVVRPGVMAVVIGLFVCLGGFLAWLVVSTLWACYGPVGG